MLRRLLWLPEDWPWERTAGAQPAGGVVHVSEYDPATPDPGTVILTGAIFDHGVDQAGFAGPNHSYNKLALTKGCFR